jgi:3-oxoacyl-[acyl-carrier-protein] synthase III
VHWEGRMSRPGLRGGNVLSVEQTDDYPLRTLECAERTVKELASSATVEPGPPDLLVAAGPSPDFPTALALRLGIDPARVVSSSGHRTGAHTAGLLVGLETAARGGRLSGTGTVLLVSAGSGITVIAALYRP